MLYRQVGASDLRASVIGLGALNFGNPKRIPDPEVSVRVVHAALDAGINFIDTAEAYSEGESERHVGLALRGRREATIIATKFKLSDYPSGDERIGRSVRERITLSIEGSLRPLETDHVDLYQLHPHTILPFFGVTCPNFSPGIGDVRDFLLSVNEANNWRPGGKNEVRTMLFVLDVTAWEHPMTVSTFRVPDAPYIGRGGRFGPHQFAETHDGRLYDPAANDNLLFLAYFSGGLRIVDVSDPFAVREVGHYVPATTERTLVRPSRFEASPELQGLDKRVIQSNDVDLDHRGLAYLSDRAGTGLHVIEFTGRES